MTPPRAVTGSGTSRVEGDVCRLYLKVNGPFFFFFFCRKKAFLTIGIPLSKSGPPLGAKSEILAESLVEISKKKKY